MQDLILSCHVRKSQNLDTVAAIINIDITGPGHEKVKLSTSIVPTLDWTSESSANHSIPLLVQIPDVWIGQQIHWQITVSDNDLLICGYSDHRFNIVSSPLWDGLPGPYDISQHIPGGGSLGTGSLPIYAGQTVTFDSKVLAVELPPAHDQKWWLITSKWPDLNGFCTDISDPNRYSTGPSSSSAILDMPE